MTGTKTPRRSRSLQAIPRRSHRRAPGGRCPRRRPRSPGRSRRAGWRRPGPRPQRRSTFFDRIGRAAPARTANTPGILLPAPTSRTMSPRAYDRVDGTPEHLATKAITDHRPVHLELRVHRVQWVLDRRPHTREPHRPPPAWPGRYIHGPGDATLEVAMRKLPGLRPRFPPGAPLETHPLWATTPGGTDGIVGTRSEQS